jgi:hypothetical protein
MLKTGLPKARPKRRKPISFEEAMERLSRGDRFRAATYAMNTLLVQKGIYSPEEFEFHFRQFAQKYCKESDNLPNEKENVTRKPSAGGAKQVSPG